MERPNYFANHFQFDIRGVFEAVEYYDSKRFQGPLVRLQPDNVLSSLINEINSINDILYCLPIQCFRKARKVFFFDAVFHKVGHLMPKVVPPPTTQSFDAVYHVVDASTKQFVLFSLLNYIDKMVNVG